MRGLRGARYRQFADLCAHGWWKGRPSVDRMPRMHEEGEGKKVKVAALGQVKRHTMRQCPSSAASVFDIS